MWTGRAPLTASCGLFICLAAIASPVAAQDRLNTLIAVAQDAAPFQDLIDLNADPFGFADGKHYLRVSQATMNELRRRGVDFEVVYEDLDAAYKAYRARLVFPRNVDEFNDYLSLEQVEAKMRQLADDFPDIVAMEEIGRSIENRPIYALRISDNAPEIEPDEPGMLVIGCHHAREWISVSVPLFFADYLAENYRKNAQVTRLITYSELWIVPVLNPDGYAYSRTDAPGARFWRKNRRANNPTPAEQSISITGNISGGVYTLGLQRSSGESVTTEPIPFDADLAEVQSAIDVALGTPGRVLVSGSPPAAFGLLFDGEGYTGRPQDPIGVDIEGLDGAEEVAIERTVMGSSESIGVDPNRNYSVGFDGPGASDSLQNETYHGPSAFSEPETQAVRDLLEGGFGRSFVTGLTYHSFSQLVLYPNAYIDAPVSNLDYYQPLAEEMTRLINDAHSDPTFDYMQHRSSGLDIAGGVFTDWAHHALGMTALIIELRPKGAPFFELPPAEIIPTAQENLPAFLFLAEQTMIPGVIELDTDDDGLMGADDLCPDTPTPRIDAQGCDDSQQDADGDGVSGADDLCTDSLPDQQVDEFGCRLEPQYGIDISSNVDGVSVAIEPADVDGLGTDSTTIEGTRHEYATVETITLSAPDTHRGLVFRQWVIDGQPEEAGQAVAIIEGGADVVARAEYVIPVGLEVAGPRRIPDMRAGGNAFTTNYTATIRFNDGSNQAPLGVTWTLDNEKIGLIGVGGQFVPFDVGADEGERFATLSAAVELGDVRLVSPPLEISVYDANSAEPRCFDITISGPDELPSGEAAAYSAMVRLDGDASAKTLPDRTSWVLEFADDGPHDGVRTMPTIADGVLDAGRTDQDTAVIVAAAFLNDDGTSCIAKKTVTLRAVEGEVQRDNPTMPGMGGTCGATGGAALILVMLGFIGMRLTRR